MNPEQPTYGRDNLMVIAAMRYCLGRSSYIVSHCVDWLIWLWPQLDEKTKETIQRAIDDGFKRDDGARDRYKTLPKPLRLRHYALGMDMDRAEWERVRALWA